MPLLKTGGILTVNGLDVSKPAEYLDPTNTPSAQNMIVDRSELGKRSGTSTIGDTLGGTDKDVMGGVEFTREGVKYNIVVGLEKIEKYNSGGDTWDDITGTDLTATVDDPVCFATPLLSDARIVCFTNGVDNIRKWNATGNTADLGGTPPKAKYMTAFGSYMLLANITNDGSGNTRQFRVQWCDTGDVENWSSGNSGSKDLFEGADAEEITGLNVFRNFVTVHTRSSVYLGTLVSSSTIFKFDPVEAFGTISNNTIQNLPSGVQVYLSKDGLRVFNGITAPLVENKVLDEIRESLNFDAVDKCWSIVVPEKNEYWVGVPIGDQTLGETVYKYNYVTGAVHKDIRESVTAAWNYSDETSLTWDDISTDWDSMTGRWDDSSSGAGFKPIIFGKTDGATEKTDKTVNNDAGTAVDAFWDSKDFTSGEIGRMSRWLGVEIWAKGNGVTVSYSTDGGNTWTVASTVTLGSDYPGDDGPDIVYFDTVSSKLRLRFRNNTAGETFNLKQFSIRYMPRELRG